MLTDDRLFIAGLRKSGFLLVVLLFIATLVSINIYLFFSKLSLDQRAVFIETTLLAALFSSVGVSLITVLRLGLKTTEGKYYLSLVIAMTLWSGAESIWAYSSIVLGIEMPYPSIADFFWLFGFVFLSYHYYYSFRVWKQARIIKLRSLFVSVASTSVLIGILIYLSIQNGGEERFDITTTIVSNLYLIGNGVLLVPAIVIIWSLRRKDVLLLHRILLSLFVIINMLGDVGFVYHEILVEETVFPLQEWIWPLIYTISYLVLITGLIWYNKISADVNNNVKNALDKQYPHLERLWNVTANNFERNEFESEKAYSEYITDPEQIDLKVRTVLRDAREEILFLISTEEMFLKAQNDIIKFVNILFNLNIHTRILIPGSGGLQGLAFELNKHSRISFQRLYKSLNEDSAIFIVDSNVILALELGKAEDLSRSEKGHLFYSNKQGQVQSYIALFENCWVLPLLHEKIPNR